MFSLLLFNTPEILTQEFCDRASAALEKMLSEKQSGVVHVIATSLAEISALNEYRGKTGPTDILTFSYYRAENAPDDVAGEIYLCLEKIQLYAQERGITYHKQLERIIVHGLVHLMGYDHETPNESEHMEAIEERILVHIGQ